MIEFFRTLQQYRGILFYRTLASLRADARGMYLGYVWWLLEPVLNTALYYFIFGVMLKIKTPDFIAYLLVGTSVYQWYQSSIMGTMGTITARAHLYRQIPLPKFLFSLVAIFSNTWKFFCVFTIIIAYILVSTDCRLQVSMLWVPVIAAIQLLLVFGLSILLSIGSAYVRDLQTFMAVIFRALMFLSAIFWDVRMVPDDMRPFFFANPAANLINAYRDVIIHGKAPDFAHLIYLFILSVLIIQIGMFWHRKVDGHILKRIQA